MMITVHLSDGRKITKDSDKLDVFNPNTLEPKSLRLEEGKIAINWWHIVDIRPAEPDEIEHAKIHGW